MNTEHNLLVALLAVRLDLLSLEDLRDLWPGWRLSPEGEFADFLADKGRLDADDKPHLEYLLHRSLKKHGGSTRAGLDSLLPGGQWQAFLHGDFSTLKGSVASSLLPPPPDTPPLGLAPRAGDFLFAATVTDAPPAAGPAPTLPAGGPRFLRQTLHGSGGIGRVWLARDQRLERDVALKELRPELATQADVGRRFLAEARITGRLEHPGIVPIYELVQDASGVSYVMRFLRGRTLSEAIKAYHRKANGASAGLERAELLQAFVAVCNTVAFAHSRRVLHRDLKGQNVLLGDFGEVIVLDWGLAKDTSRTDAEQSSAISTVNQASDQTQAGQIMGTPRYMPPEQAAGETHKIDVRSDVYSLGAILYEILTGSAPFQDQLRLLADVTLESLLQLIREKRPTRPRTLAPDTPPPLEAICLRALAKKREDRYQSAAELAKEVQRWLADEPVAAHPDPWTVRVGRWARRHRTAVTSLGVLLLATVAGLAATTVLVNDERERTATVRDTAETNFRKEQEAVRLLGIEKSLTEQARARAESNFRKAQEAVDRYFTKVSEERLLNEAGMLPLRRELLASARAFYEDFARQQQGDPAGQQALGESLLKLARITKDMGERPHALKLQEEAQGIFRKLIDDQRRAGKITDADQSLLALAQGLMSHGYQSFLLKGRTPEAQAELELARDTLATLVHNKPTRLHRSELAHAHNTIAVYFQDAVIVDDPAATRLMAQQSTQSLRAAVDLWRQLADEEPDEPARLNDLAGGYNNLAIDASQAKDMPTAGTYFDKAITLRQRLVERFPHNVEYRENLAGSYNNQGNYLRNTNQPEPAEAAFRKAIALRDKLAKDNCQVVQFQQRLGNTHLNLGNHYYLQLQSASATARAGLFVQSQESYQRAVDVFKRLHEDHPEEHRLKVDYAFALAGMGDLMTESKKSQAVPWYDQAIPLLEEALGRGEKAGSVSRFLRNARWGRADAHMEAGKFPQAILDWDRAIELDDGSHVAEWRGLRALARLEVVRKHAKDGAHDKAAAGIDSMLKDAPTAQRQIDAARVLADCAALAREETMTALVETYAARAVALIRQAHGAGYFGQNMNRAVLDGFRKLDALKDRGDFRQLVKEIEAK